MASAQSVSIRIPQELLEQLDAIAIQEYPPRNSGTPNRSRMILDFIHRGIESYNTHGEAGIQRQTSTDCIERTKSDRDIEELIRQQVQIQFAVQQQMQQQLEQQRQHEDQASEIAGLRQGVAEIKKP